MYMAPEMWRFKGHQYKGFTEAADMWSVGIMAFQWLDGHPFVRSNALQLLENPKQWPAYIKRKFEKSVEISNTEKDFLQNLLVIDPKDRSTAEEALNHPYFGIPNTSRDCP